ncbi:methyltransferase [Lithospermum erythrorhizon]|uniref:Methyltransferase n=1 Tax=Lithospermum erythrorhizon TaxID=34254 RepID=A0AAV3PSL3_LITER
MASFSLHIQPINTTQLPSSLSLQKFSCFFISSTPFFSSKPIFSQSNTRKWSNHKDTCSVSSSVEECNNEDGSEYKVLTAIRSSFNDIVILETADSRMLLLDATHNVHSIFNKGNKWTGSYWDQFVSLPPIVPKGPIAIFGLGGGTAAQLLLEVWPMLQLDGWEIDEILVYKARDYLGLADLENQTEAGGRLNVIVGDALSSSATIPGGYAGIIVDLFSEGQVLPQLQEVEYWLGLQQRLMPNGRIMINCGGSVDESVNTWESNSTICALHEAFPSQLSWMKLPKDKGANFLALTGPLPDLTLWADTLPEILRLEVRRWRTCSPS